MQCQNNNNLKKIFFRFFFYRTRNVANSIVFDVVFIFGALDPLPSSCAVIATRIKNFCLASSTSTTFFCGGCWWFFSPFLSLLPLKREGDHQEPPILPFFDSQKYSSSFKVKSNQIVGVLLKISRMLFQNDSSCAMWSPRERFLLLCYASIMFLPLLLHFTQEHRLSMRPAKYWRNSLPLWIDFSIFFSSSYFYFHAAILALCCCIIIISSCPPSCPYISIPDGWANDLPATRFITCTAHSSVRPSVRPPDRPPDRLKEKLVDL